MTKDEDYCPVKVGVMEKGGGNQELAREPGLHIAMVPQRFMTFDQPNSLLPPTLNMPMTLKNLELLFTLVA